MGNSSKVPTDPNMTPDVRGFLDALQQTADDALTAAESVDLSSCFLVANNLSEATDATARANIGAPGQTQTGFININFGTINAPFLPRWFPYNATITRYSA